MKIKLLICIGILVAAGIGFLLGSNVVGGYWTRRFTDYASMTECNHADELIDTLKYARAGKLDEANDSMEENLDESLIVFAIYESTYPKSQPPAYVIRTIRIARNYRTKNPWTNSEPIIANTVQKVFHLTK